MQPGIINSSNGNGFIKKRLLQRQKSQKFKQKYPDKETQKWNSRWEKIQEKIQEVPDDDLIANVIFQRLYISIW